MQATIVYIIDPNTHEVLMAKKVRKVGVGYWFGYGGKIDEGQTAEESIIDEALKESGNIIKKENTLIPGWISLLLKSFVTEFL
jgi:hypothetical protein